MIIRDEKYNAFPYCTQNSICRNLDRLHIFQHGKENLIEFVLVTQATLKHIGAIKINGVIMNIFGNSSVC